TRRPSDLGRDGEPRHDRPPARPPTLRARAPERAWARARGGGGRRRARAPGRTGPEPVRAVGPDGLLRTRRARPLLPHGLARGLPSADRYVGPDRRRRPRPGHGAR